MKATYIQEKAIYESLLVDIQKKENNDSLQQGDVIRWVKVQDKMPPSGQCVLLYSKNSGVAEGAWLENKGLFEQWRWNAIMTNVTHWMELPEPPCTKENNDNENKFTWLNKYSDTNEPDKLGRLERRLFYKDKYICLITYNNHTKHFKIVDYFPSNRNFPCHVEFCNDHIEVLKSQAEQRFSNFLNDIS